MKQEKRRNRRIIVILLLSVLGLYIAAGFTVTGVMLNRYFARSDKRAYFSSRLSYEALRSEFPREELSFPSGPNELTGAVYGGGTAGLVVFVHGFGGNMDSYMPSVQYFVRRGWRVLAYNGTGVDGSGGGGRVNLSQAVTDLRAALDYVKNDGRFGGLPVVLFGHSQGAFAVCAVFNYPEGAGVEACVSFAGMNNPRDMVDMYGKAILGGFYPLFKPFAYVMNHTDYAADKNAVSGINGADIPFLLIQGAADTEVLPDSAAITHFADDITNPNVEIMILADEWNSGHNGIFYSKEALDYREEINATLEPYRLSRGIDVFTDGDTRAWADEVQFDYVTYNALNLDIFDRIDAFYKNAVAR